MERAGGRTVDMEYPDYSAEIEAIETGGITTALLERIIARHRACAEHMRRLYGRYQIRSGDVPIFGRAPRFGDAAAVDQEGRRQEYESESPINNRVNNDFFSEIVDVKVGYFAGKPANYTYGDDYQAEEETGGEEAVRKAAKALSDFVKRNNLFDIDMETTKLAAICGYAGRLVYIDGEGNERVMVTPPFETIILSRTELTEPEYAVRYYPYLGLDDRSFWRAEFYDAESVHEFEGQLGTLKPVGESRHVFGRCPLQGIPNNRELMGDAEKVLALIDDYDSSYSDNSNDIEGFANAYMVFKNCKVDKETMATANATGVIGIDVDDPDAPYDVYYLTKSIDGTFVNNHLDRAEDNIYRFSKTPNLNDPEFTAASGMALRIKMTGLETKAGTFEAKQVGAATYLFELLAESFQKKGIPFDSMQCSVKYNRNFPTDFLGEAQAVQALVAAGLPRQMAFRALSFVDDVGQVMRMVETEQEGGPDGAEDTDKDRTDDGPAGKRYKEQGARGEPKAGSPVKDGDGLKEGDAL